jgi:hypothetical protein
MLGAHSSVERRCGQPPYGVRYLPVQCYSGIMTCMIARHDAIHRMVAASACRLCMIRCILQNCVVSWYRYSSGYRGFSFGLPTPFFCFQSFDDRSLLLLSCILPCDGTCVPSHELKSLRSHQARAIDQREPATGWREKCLLPNHVPSM